jgi:hypothetical protein
VLVQDLCATGASTSHMSAAETLWGAVSKSDLCQDVVAVGRDTEIALLTALPNEAPRCLGNQMQVSGKLHGSQTGSQRQLLVTADDEEWSFAAAQLCMGQSSVDGNTEVVEHSFTAPCVVDWDTVTGVGTVKVPDRTEDVQGGIIRVQVGRKAVHSQQKHRKRRLDRRWMWELLWAEALDKPSICT